MIANIKVVVKQLVYKYFPDFSTPLFHSQTFFYEKKQIIICFSFFEFIVFSEPLTGLEPVTFSLPWKCSTN